MTTLTLFLLLCHTFLYAHGTPLSVVVYSEDSDQYYAKEVLIVEVISSFGNGEILSYTFDFGDGSNITTSESKVTHSYLLVGRYTISGSVDDGAIITTSNISIVIQQKPDCYNFQLYTDNFGTLSQSLVVPTTNTLTLYCRITNPLQTNYNDSISLTNLFYSLGETPTLSWTSSLFSFTPFLDSFSDSFGAWTTVVTYNSDNAISTSSKEIVQISISPKGVGIYGCGVQSASFTINIAKFSNENIMAPSDSVIDSSIPIVYSQDPCSPSSAIGFSLGTNQILFGTDDTFGDFTQTISLPPPFSDGSLWDVKIIPGGDVILLTSFGLIRGFFNTTSLTYDFAKVTVGAQYIDDGGFDSRTVSLFASNFCPEASASPYSYLIYTLAGVSSVMYSKGLTGDQWVMLINTLSYQNQNQNWRFKGAVWLADVQSHLLLVQNETLFFTLVCDLEGVCQIGYIFPEGSQIFGLILHSTGNDVIAFGDGVYSSVIFTNVFDKIIPLETGEFVTNFATTDSNLGYAMITNKENIYYGRTTVDDVANLQSPFSNYLQNSSLIFDGSGQLYNIILGNSLNFSNLTTNDDVTLRRTILPVSASIYSSNYALNCSLGILFLTTPGYVAFYVINSNPSVSCTPFWQESVGRNIGLLAGGSALITDIDSSNLFVTANIVDSFQPVAMAPSDAIMLRLAASPTSTFGPQIDIIGNNLLPNYIGFTLVFQLGSVFITSYVNSTFMEGVVVGCNSTNFDWVGLLQKNTTDYYEILISTIPNYASNLITNNDGTRNWLISGGSWQFYDFSNSEKYQILSECAYTSLQLLPKDNFATNDASLRYLDVGEVLELDIYVVPDSVDLQLILSNPSSIIVDSISQNFGNDGTKLVSLVFSGTPAGENCTVLLRPTQTSLSCPQAQVSAQIIQACDPAKEIFYNFPFSFDSFVEFGEIPMHGDKPYLKRLPVNYRPPSSFGQAIPTSDNIYNADPSKPRYFDAFKISKTTGRYKQCTGKENRAECACTPVQTYSGFEKDSDCIELAYLVPWKNVFMPNFGVNLNGAMSNNEFLLEYTIQELNGRTDYCFNTSSVDCSSQFDVENFVITIGGLDFIGIQFSGSELFHFRVTMKNPSLCMLTTEFVIWAENPPLPQFLVWVILSCSAIGFALLLYGGFLFYSYLYNSGT